MSTALGVIGLVVGILVFNVVIWVVILSWIRRRTAEAMAAFHAEVASTGERVLIAAEPGIYRGGTNGFPGSRGNGVIALTDRRFWCRRATGGIVEVPVSRFDSVREERWFRSSANASRMHVVLRTREGAEVAFFTRDNEKWLHALRSAGATGTTHG